MAARQELSRQRFGLASPNNSDTHDSNGGRGRRGSGGGATSYTSAPSVEAGAGGVTGYTVAAPVEDWRVAVETSRGGAGEDRSRRISREPAAGVMDRRRELGLGETESTHRRNLQGRTTRLLRLE